MNIRIQSALISVYHKEGLDPLLDSLVRLGVTLYATGGTFDHIADRQLPVIAVEDITGFPSILGGRVKTLHPAVFGGILHKREDAGHLAEMEQHSLPPIDLVVVDLYPFTDTVRSGGDHHAIIEKIDIGGISLIRAAAKNHADVVIIPSRDHYGELQRILDEQDGSSSLEDRKQLAMQAFRISSTYDRQIATWMERGTLDDAVQVVSDSPITSLRYGENPHQQAIFHGRLDEILRQLHGKELSYNNLLDIDAACNLIAEFDDPSIAIIKHNNACGLATSDSLIEAWEKALAGDPVSAFGGVLISNRIISKDVAEAMDRLFFEVLISPGYEPAALELLKSKKNRILLEMHGTPKPTRLYRSVLNGILEQDADGKTEQVHDFRIVTKRGLSQEETRDLIFANKIVKHSKSNAIVLAKNGQLLGSGTGQTSRVDALQQAIAKARHFGFNLEGAVMASDAFFPFPDCVEISSGAGIKCIVQPGGSVRDSDSIEKADELGCAMAVTGTRHFKH